MKIKNLRYLSREDRQTADNGSQQLLTESLPWWALPLLLIVPGWDEVILPGADPTDPLFDPLMPQWLQDLLYKMFRDGNSDGIIGDGMLYEPWRNPWGAPIKPSYGGDPVLLPDGTSQGVDYWWHYIDPDTGELWVCPWETGPYVPHQVRDLFDSYEEFLEWYETFDPNDWDGDGIPNESDEEEFEPFGDNDSDGDGFPDDIDDDPNDPNVPIEGGLPDDDGDGIPNHLDPDWAEENPLVPDLSRPPVDPLPPGFLNPWPGSVDSPKNQPPAPRMPQPGL